MSWALAVVSVAAMGALVALVHVVLPYVKPRTDVEKRVEALEAANVELKDKAARLEQFTEYMSGGQKLPRMGVTRTG